MDASVKQRALEQAVELTKTALASPTGNNCAVAHPDSAVKFLEDTYRKLVELWGEAITPKAWRRRRWQLAAPPGSPSPLSPSPRSGQ